MKYLIPETSGSSPKGLLSPYEPFWFPCSIIKFSTLERFLFMKENQNLKLYGIVINKKLAIRVDRI